MRRIIIVLLCMVAGGWQCMAAASKQSADEAYQQD